MGFSELTDWVLVRLRVGFSEVTDWVLVGLKVTGVSEVTDKA